MTGLVFVDTHVLVSARDARDSAKRALANDWLRLLWNEERGRTSCQVLSDYYDFVTQLLESPSGQGDIWDDVQHYLTWSPQAIDAEVLVGAHEFQQRYLLDWKDCLVMSAAQAQGCVLVLSEGLQDGAEYGGIVVRSPFTLRVSDERGAYTLPPQLPPRHRGRGRPRRTPPATAHSTGLAKV
jgi:predicted nucleic acid-binding protein